MLRTVRYHNGSNAPDATPRVVHFVANDGTSDGNTAISTVTVVPVDTAPTAVDDGPTVAEDSGANAIDVLTNDTDADGGPISITSVTQPGQRFGRDHRRRHGTHLHAERKLLQRWNTFRYVHLYIEPGGSTATVSCDGDVLG